MQNIVDRGCSIVYSDRADHRFDREAQAIVGDLHLA